MSITIKYFFLASIVLICAYVSVLSVLRANADAGISEINSVISGWLARKTTYSELSEQLGFITSSSPSLPQLSSAKARVYHNCSRSIGACDEIGTSYTSKAKAQYELGIAQRPHWAGNYVGLAQLKADQLNFDEEFYKAFSAGIEFGTYEASSIVGLSKISVTHWAQFDFEQRQRNIEVVRIGLTNKRPFVKRQVIDNLIAATKSYPSKLDPYLLEQLDLWLAADNNLRANERVRLALSFWSYWQGETKLSAISTLAEVSSKYGVRRTINSARKTGKLSVLCAVLPRSKVLQTACTNNRLKR